jgi:hypothetical protein
MSTGAGPADDPWGKQTLDGLERKNLWVVFVASAAAWIVFSGEWALNVLGAGVLGALNLRALRRTIEVLFGGTGKPSRWFVVASTVRFMVFLSLLVAVFVLLPVRIVPFAAGLSTVVVAAAAEGIDQALHPDGGKHRCPKRDPGAP